MTEHEGRLQVERYSIDYIPEDERYGHPRSLFTIWFATNLQVTAIVTGALGVILGLPLPWAILGIVVGNAVGAGFLALHSGQGPRLGVPQMIQSRAQFGFYGAILPLALFVVMYVGFFATSAVLGGQALAAATGMNLDLAIVIVAATCMMLAIYGYRLIHAADRWISLINGLGFAYLTVRLFQTKDVASVWTGGNLPVDTFLLVVAIAATWQIAYGPYVADYSRYLPEQTSIPTIFWWSYAGTFIAAVWMMSFGCLAVAVTRGAFNGGSVDFIVSLAPGGHAIFSAMIILGVISVNVLDLYGTFMASATMLTAIRPHGIGPRARTVYVIGSAAAGSAIAIIGHDEFLANYANFILFLAYFLIPWTSINLTDFYLVRKGRYNIGAIFDSKGEYGNVSWPALIAYAVAITVEVPFMKTAFYEGPMVSLLGGTNIAWILGIFTAGGLYYLLTRKSLVARLASQGGDVSRNR